MADEAVYISHVQQEVEIETDDDNSFGVSLCIDLHMSRERISLNIRYLHLQDFDF